MDYNHTTLVPETPSAMANSTVEQTSPVQDVVTAIPIQDTIVCQVIEAGVKVICNGTAYHVPEPPLQYTDPEFWIYLGIYLFLVCFAG